MQNIRDISGINLFVGTSKTIQQIPDDSKHYALVITMDEQEQISSLDYYDPIHGRISLLNQLTNPQQTMAQVKALAQSRSITIDHQNCHMLHLNPTQLRATFPAEIQHHIKSEVDYAETYFNDPLHLRKFNRKDSGLSHSYLHDLQQGTIQLANKDECRVVWTQQPPSQAVFENLPSNTAAAYIVVTDQHGENEKIYYLKKSDDDIPAPAISVDIEADIPFLQTFKLNNRGLSHDELTDLEKNLHISNKENIYGTGGFARVKKARAIHEEGHTEIATKILKLKKRGKFEGKFGGRNTQEANARREAETLSDLRFGSPDLLIIEDKGYMHMRALGEPITKKTHGASTNKKLDYAIKFLVGVDAVHSGAASDSLIKRAHRDLKPDNVLVDKHDRLHIIDHGLVTTDLDEKTSEPGGTLYYAPLDQEVIDYYLTQFKKPKVSDVKQASDSVMQSDATNMENIEDSAQDFFDTPTTQAPNASLSDDDDDELVEEWETTVGITAAKPSSDTATIPLPDASKPKLPALWVSCLANPTLCITQNYLEDDKIAALRTVYCNPNPKAGSETCSILDTQDFETLPQPIRELLDSTYIAPLLNPLRRQETEGFFAAVLIFYQQNPNLSDAEYAQIISDLRSDPIMQAWLIESFEHSFSSEEASDVTSDLEESMDDEELLTQNVELEEKIKPRNITMMKDAELLEQRVELKGKIKPENVSMQEKRSLYQIMRDKFSRIRGRSSSSISPLTDTSDPSDTQSVDTHPSKKPKR